MATGITRAKLHKAARIREHIAGAQALLVSAANEIGDYDESADIAAMVERLDKIRDGIHPKDMEV